MSEKTFAFLKQQDLLNMNGYCCFPVFVILPVRMHLIAFLVFFFVHDFPTKASWIKSLFSQRFRTWATAVSDFRAHCEGKKKKIDP